MAEPAFKVGDRVRVKGINSPRMVVSSTHAILGLPVATCVWFHEGQMQCGTVAFAVLALVLPLVGDSDFGDPEFGEVALARSATGVGSGARHAADRD